MFTFEPFSEEEIEKKNLLERGVYPFQVLQATQKKSKSGNDMIELILNIMDNNGKQHQVFDYLVSLPSLAYKIRHFCYSIGMGEKYEAGSFNAEDCLDKCGYAVIFVKEDASGQYKSKNAVSDYQIKKPEEQQSFNIQKPKDEPLVDDPLDDCPF